MKDGQDAQIRKFNPGTFQSDQAIIEQFVVRQRELGIVLDTLETNLDSPSCQHILVVGPRGRGKSMLLARVTAALRADRTFSEHLFPVRFMEESQEIFNIADFWLETLFYLARELASSNPELSQELRATHEDLTGKWHDEGLGRRALSAVLDVADRLNRRLVLMVENLQTLCEDTDEDFGWQLRKTLQSENQIMLLATATSRFEGLEDAQQPFFELFKLIHLHPLDTEECRRLWQVISKDIVSTRDIRPLQILTGGSPRLLVIVAEFALHRSLRQLMEELVTLIDNHTEYFRGHLDSFAKTERRVYLAVIDLWQPSSTSEIAARARMEVRTVSTLLGRLVKRGAVSAEGDGRRRRYAAAERLYSIYYKLRRERDEAAVVRNLVHFMVLFYKPAEPEELAELSGILAADAARSPGIRDGFERAIADIPAARDFLPNRLDAPTERGDDNGSGIGEADFESLFEEIDTARKDDDFERVIECVDRCLDSSAIASPPDVARALLHKGFAQGQLGSSAAAIDTYNDLIERYTSSDQLELQVPVARALCNKGITERQLGNPTAAIDTCNDLVERYTSSDKPEIQVQVARALLNRGIAEWQLGNSTAAIDTSNDLIQRYTSSDQPELQVQVAKALFNKGQTQLRTGDAGGALTAASAIERKFGSLVDEEAVPFGWQALWVRAEAFLAQTQPAEALSAFESLFTGFDPDNEKMMSSMLTGVPELIRLGANASEMLKILLSDQHKCDVLQPLVLAVRQEAGETVRAPAEVLEVAADIRERMRAAE